MGFMKDLEEHIPSYFYTLFFGENTVSGLNERYKDHPSINLIKSKNSYLASTFSFDELKS